MLSEPRECQLWVRPRASRQPHCPTADSLLRRPRQVPSQSSLPLATSTAFPPWPSQDKGWSPQQVSPSGFYYKEGSRASQPPLPAQSPRLQARHCAGWVCCWGARGAWFRVSQRVTCDRNRMGDFLRVARGFSARSACSLEQSFPVLRLGAPLSPPQVLRASGSYSQLERGKFKI